MLNLKFRKRIYIYFFLIFLLTSFNNYNFQSKNFFTINTIKIVNPTSLLENSSKYQLKLKTDFLIGENIFFFDKVNLFKILKNENFIDSYELSINYPDTLVLNITQAYPIAYINSKNKYFGNNFKVLDFDEKKIKIRLDKLPTIFGNPSPEDFKNLVNHLYSSNIEYEEITYFYFHNSKRWDLELSNKIKIKLPFSNIVNSLNIADTIIKNKYLLIENTIDLTVGGQIILS